MAELVTISSFTANTPIEVYYCDSFSANCVYVGSATTFPYSFTVPSPMADSNFLVKIIDSTLCELGEIVYVIPTPTPTNTPTISVTPSFTPTPSPTRAVGPNTVFMGFDIL